MPFTTETQVRLKTQIDGDSLATPELVDDCIAEAHTLVLARLAPETPTGPPPALLVLGETLLAAALLLRALASRDAVLQKQITLGGQRIDAGKRFAALQALAFKNEARAWRTLAPFLKPRPPASPLALTQTKPVLGAD